MMMLLLLLRLLLHFLHDPSYGFYISVELDGGSAGRKQSRWDVLLLLIHYIEWFGVERVPVRTLDLEQQTVVTVGHVHEPAVRRKAQACCLTTIPAKRAVPLPNARSSCRSDTYT
jgi:hypothetical protein